MKKDLKHLICNTFLLFLFLFSNLFGEFNLVELNPGFDYAEWYKKETGFNPDSIWFGAWVIAPRNDELYFGFATARPAESDGALLAKWVGEWLMPVGQFSEQGVHCIKWIGDTLYGIGSDPSITDGWDGGNFYRYFPLTGVFEKVRYDKQKKPVLPNVIHSWGLFHDSTNNKFYMSTGSYDPQRYSKNGNDCGSQYDSTIACFGEIWQSNDFGNSWSLNSGGKNNNISSNRIYDIIKFNSVLYIVEAELNNLYYLKKSTDDGLNWTVINDINPSPLFRMCIFNNKLIVAANIARTLYIIDSNDSISIINMPGALNYSFNVFANVEDKYLITYFSDGSVYSTYDFASWNQLIPPTGKNFLSIAYWESKKTVALAERRGKGSIWKVDITELLSTGVKNLIEPEIVINSDKNYLTISSHNYGISSVEIFDVLGYRLYLPININPNQTKIDISELSSGLYFVKVCNSKNNFIRKLLKY